MSIYVKKFGTWLFTERNKQNMSIRELHRLSGISQDYISGLEKNTLKSVDLEKASKLITSLGFDDRKIILEIC